MDFFIKNTKALVLFFLILFSNKLNYFETKISHDLYRLISVRNILCSLSSKEEQYLLTAYSPTKEECDDSPFITADGSKVRFGIVAGDKVLRFGTKLYIKGLGIFHVHDRGGLIKGKRLDIFFFCTNYAKQFGVQRRNVLILD